MDAHPDTFARLAHALGGQFHLVRELGGGGMSRVFLAREVALGREVVVKVVPIEGGAAAVERFKREIQTAARLQHPHIVPVLTAGVADGVPWFTMPFVSGDSLRARLAAGGALPPADAMKVLRDVAQALAFAHEHGFIHRDIKPDNVLLADGVAVVTDFGVAKALSSATSAVTSSVTTGMTAVGMALGTPAYMAPEQASADPTVDHRADLYAWGCMAYELLAGVTPFGARTPSQLFAAHLTEPPLPLAPRAADCPPALAALVMRCLEKDPARRPQTARELLAALDAMVTPSGARGAAPVPHRAAPAWARGAMVMGGAALVALAGWWIRSRPASSAAAPAAADSAPAEPSRAGTALAVLPFVNTGGDPQDEYFSDGMTDELTHALSRLPGLRLAGRSTAFSYKGRSVPAQEIGRAIGVKAIVEGTVRRSGPRVRVTAQLTSTGDGRVLWSDSFERTDRDVFAVQDAVTAAIVGALSPLLGGATPGVASLTGGADTRGTTDAAAYDLYLRGRFFWAQRGITPMDSALAYFRQAVQRDPRFARGWAGLALTHVVRPNYNARVPARASFDSAESAARRALALDSTLADAHSALAMAQAKHLDVRGAMATFDRAIRLEPQNANAHHWAGLVSGWAGDIPRAVRELEQALALDPLSAALLNTAAMVAAERRRPDEAGPRWERAYALSDFFRLSTWFSGANISRVALGQGDSIYRAQQRVLAVPAQRQQVELSRLFFSTRMLAAAAVSDWRQARALRDTIMGGRQPGILAFDRALVATLFGTRAEAAALFIESLRDEGPIANLAMTPCLAALEFVRTEPSYRAFLAQHGLAECPLPPGPWPLLRAPEAPAP